MEKTVRVKKFFVVGISDHFLVLVSLLLQMFANELDEKTDIARAFWNDSDASKRGEILRLAGFDEKEAKTKTALLMGYGDFDPWDQSFLSLAVNRYLEDMTESGDDLGYFI
jgi:hypothetical protein